MSKHKGMTKLNLTGEQQKLRKEIGGMGDTLELSITELEERIAPGYYRGG